MPQQVIYIDDLSSSVRTDMLAGLPEDYSIPHGSMGAYIPVEDAFKAWASYNGIAMKFIDIVVHLSELRTDTTPSPDD